MAVIRGRSVASGAMVGLRADMDALAADGAQRLSWKSCKPGLMHGCGHDGHTAMLVGLRASRRRVTSTARPCWYSSRAEGFAGARVMMEDGLFDRFPVQSIYAMHNWPAMKPGTIGINPGP